MSDGLNGRAILAQGLVRDFGKVRAVDGVDLSVAEGEIYGFLGPNGAGKSTVVRMLTTLLLPTAGRAFIAGLDMVDRPKQVRMRIGAALQDAALDNKQTGRELLRLQASLFGLSRREAKVRIRELEDLIDIGDAMDRLISTYSGGMKRRLDLAAALIHAPGYSFLMSCLYSCNRLSYYFCTDKWACCHFRRASMGPRPSGRG